MFDNNYKGKIKYFVSILGDSISTYEGFNPFGYPVYYKEDRLYDNGLESVNDTWWKIVLDSVGGELCVNNSFSGSFVSGMSEYSACSIARCSSLHIQTTPNLVLIYMGTNDRGYNVEIGMDEPDNIEKFYGSYRTMLERVKRNYPSAKIVCCTLLNGYLKDIGDNTPKTYGGEYNNAIRQAVQVENCFLADIALSGKRYETLDRLHPTKKGHSEIAQLWLNALKDIL